MSFPDAWPGATACFSVDGRESWRRKTDTVYDEGKGTLSWVHVHEEEERGCYFSYFEPYEFERHLDLVDRCGGATGAAVSVIGRSLEGRSIEMITVGTGSLNCWIQCRQHPGETQAEWFAEGLLERLCGLAGDGSVDGLTHKALSAFTFRIIPNVNPDGSAHGYLRCNAGGQNLNREWCDSKTLGGEVYKAPTLERSPEVYYVLKKMDEVGVDCFADIHGDEALPFNFIAGCEGLPNWGPRMQGLQGAFLGAYCRANPDMQREVSYEPDEAGCGYLNVASNQVGRRFDCLAVTLEMPYKDCVTCPDPERGYTGRRCKQLGASVVDAFMNVKDLVRSGEVFWESLQRGDEYVRPREDWEGK